MNATNTKLQTQCNHTRAPRGFKKSEKERRASETISMFAPEAALRLPFLTHLERFHVLLEALELGRLGA